MLELFLLFTGILHNLFSLYYKKYRLSVIQKFLVLHLFAQISSSHTSIFFVLMPIASRIIQKQLRKQKQAKYLNLIN